MLIDTYIFNKSFGFRAHAATTVVFIVVHSLNKRLIQSEERPEKGRLFLL